MKPFLKWVGGKSAQAEDIVRRFPDDWGYYWEPFLGGGAVYFYLENDKAVLSDANPHLINTYRTLQDPNLAEPLISLVERYGAQHNKDFYYAKRGQFNSITSHCLAKAGLFIYLNWTCFNGLWRVNSKGKMNSPVGKPSGKRSYIDSDRLREAHKLLQGATIANQDFTYINPKPGDVVYLDPPYLDTHTAYTPQQFTERDHRILAGCAHHWARQGAYVYLSHSEHPLIRGLYPGWKIIKLQTKNTIGGKGASRQPREDWLLTNRW